MADEIALSIYIQEIEDHIRQNRAADALALCRYILHYYPKHLETYSWMAQALLEQGDLNGALDVYRRVLSADPENTGAYVGLAQVFDSRGELDEAVWHMERAYELAPAQPDIRQELLRLYTQLEGTPRERLKLTRGALVRLYVQEGLFEQAIREFREMSSMTFSRYDTRAALAETLWRAGQTREAAEVAQSLLDSLPYCLKANLILGTAWHESEIKESEDFLQRAQSLDPSNQVAQRLLGARSPLRLVQVTIPRYAEGAPPPPRATEEETVAMVREPTESAIAPSAEAREESIAEKIEPAPTREEITGPKPSVLATDLPPWLGEEAMPAETAHAEPGTPVVSFSDSEGFPDWLTELQKTFSETLEEGVPAPALPMPTGQLEEPPVKTEPPPALTVEEAAAPIESVQETRATETEQVAPTSQDEGLPDWLSGTSTEAIMEEKLAEEIEVPAWLKEPWTAESVEREEKTREEPLRVPKWVEVLSQRAPVETKHEGPVVSESQAGMTAIPSEEPAAMTPLPAEEKIKPESPVEPEMPVLVPIEAPEPKPPIVVETPLPVAPSAIPQAPVAQETPEPALRKPRRQPKYSSRLAQAREHRDEDRWSDAFAEYDFIIQKAPGLVSEVILDLEALVARGDAPLDAHRLLGDAYARAGRLNDALERYRFVYKRISESNS